MIKGSNPFISPFNIINNKELNMKYNTIEEFIDKTNVSRSTVDRFYRKYPDIGNERINVGKRKDIPESHLKYFSMDLMMKEEKVNQDKIDKLKKLLTLIREKSSLASTLWNMNWEFFGTISYSQDHSKDTCYNKMVKMFNQLKSDIEDSELKIFFTTESYDVRGGNHNHFVLNCNTRNVNQVNNLMKEHFNWNRVDLKPYNPEEAGLFYLIKDGLQGTDWDYLQ